MPAPLQKGTLLLASQELKNNYFSRCVIIITQYNRESGTMGLILNRPFTQNTDKSITSELADFLDLPSTDIEKNNLIFEGGPVDQNYLFFLHRLNDIIGNGDLITNDLYWGGDIEQAIQLQSNPNIKNQICFYRGYAGWNKNQLEQEIHSGTWILAPCDTATILSQPPEQLWHNLVYSLGGYYRAVAEMPEDPSVN